MSLVPLLFDHPVLRGVETTGGPGPLLTPSLIRYYIYFCLETARNFGLPPVMHPFRRQGGIESGASEVINDAEKFDIKLDVSHFKPEELKVKTVDKSVMIEGKHEEQMDEHGFVSRQFTRRYVLPKEVDPSTVVSSLSRDGTLIVHAPKKHAIAAKNERAIPIQAQGHAMGNGQTKE